MRPVIPTLPFDLPNSVKLLSPMLPEYTGNRDAPPQLGEAGVLASATWADLLQLGIPPTNGDAEPIDVVNHYVNYGAEYVYHCHILSHEEMDMMRPVSFVLPPKAPTGLAFVPGTLTWTDNSTNETAFLVQRSTDGTTWTDVGTVSRLFLDPLNAVLLDPVPAANTTGDTVTFTDPALVADEPVSRCRSEHRRRHVGLRRPQRQRDRQRRLPHRDGNGDVDRADRAVSTTAVKRRRGLRAPPSVR